MTPERVQAKVAAAEGRLSLSGREARHIAMINQTSGCRNTT